MNQKILITSALPYANGPLHFGHIAGAYLPGDAYARFERLIGNQVLYVCGSDEYGVAITLSAELAGRTPKEHVDHFHKINKELFQKLEFSFDHYSRTTCKYHKEPVHRYFTELYQNGFIEARVTDQLYSEKEGRFLADRYVVGVCPGCGFENARGDECPKCGASFDAIELKNPRSKLTGAPLTKKATKHWFLILDQFKDRLNAFLETKHWKPNVINFVKGYIENLHPRAITRDSTWGVPIPLPDTEGKTLYVWFDAPIGYISAAMEWADQQGKPDLWKEWWCDPKTKLTHFIGKDNIPFHAAIFPAMTMGQNQPYKLVDDLPANEFLLLEGKQFSKSDGWYIDLDDFFTRYTPDQIRYYLAANAPETSDSEFTWKDFQRRSNNELVGKFGNLANRVLVFTHQHLDGVVPTSDLQSDDKEFLENIKAITGKIKEAYSTYRLRHTCQLIMELASLGNTYFDNKKPWKEQDRTRLNTTIACCLECLKLLALSSSPIIPKSAEKLWNLLGQKGIATSGWDEILNTPLTAGQALVKPEILFKKIEDAQIMEEIAKLNQPQDTKTITIDDVKKLDLRVGLIQHAEAVEKSKRLLKLTVDLGGDIRTIVSGIRESYSAEDVIGKKVVVIANLKPAKLMGIESQGMLLAGSHEEMLELVTVQDLPPGSEVS